ncbi:hypothetical protein MMC25_007640 [Agyrium rufum]|nr:hypothetical protein [Agyrium rufum]
MSFTSAPSPARSQKLTASMVLAEHSIPTQTTSSSAAQQPPPPRRPDLSTFFSAFSQIDTSETSNANALPIPGDVAAAYRMLAEALERMRSDAQSDGREEGGILEGMIEQLWSGVERPPREVHGLARDFIDTLDRIPKKALKAADTCPICNNPFLEDPYPLVVRLPCHKSHIFDLECIEPWFKLNTTCPLDRKDLAKKKAPPPPPPKDEEEDGEYDEMFA